jgi:hypothetical protein
VTVLQLQQLHDAAPAPPRPTPPHPTHASHSPPTWFSFTVSSPSVCKYDGGCTRRNPQHFKDFTHPGLLPAQPPNAAQQLQLALRPRYPGVASVTPAQALLVMFHGILAPALYCATNPDDDNVPGEAKAVVLGVAMPVPATRAPLAGAAVASPPPGPRPAGAASPRPGLGVAVGGAAAGAAAVTSPGGQPLGGAASGRVVRSSYVDESQSPLMHG